MAVFILIILSTWFTLVESGRKASYSAPSMSAALRALEYVEKTRTSPCTGGTEEILPVQFDHAVWSAYAEVAVRMSNLLSKIIVQNGGQLSSATDEFLFDLVRNNVDGSSLIFGSAIAVEPHVHPPYKTFCPYAYKKESVYAHDLSLNYDYLDPATEWYHVLRTRNWDNAYISINYVTYRQSSSQAEISQPLARLEDGHWTQPYYDCGGGDIWMVTYSAPIFDMSGSGIAIFKGIGTIDIELTNIDINQCDLDLDRPDSDDKDMISQDAPGSVDVFRGTHRCQPTTKCVPVSGRGFIPGAYRCYCQDGFYFPDTSLQASEKFYPGTALESLFTNFTAEAAAVYTCLQCAEGCDTCTDDAPCLYAHILPLRVSLLVLSVVLIILIAMVSALVAVHRDKKVIKSASPIFLHLVCAGAILMVIPMLIFFTAANDITCLIGQWPRHIGFCLAYGGLLLKTWRITAIFKVKSAKKLNLSDKVLAQRLLPFIGITIAYLAAWSGLQVMPSEWVRTSSDLKFTNCSSSWWSYGIAIAQGCFLLWGAYLCFVVRKAPSVFNESKYITWTIYNNIILGSFIIVAREFIAMPQGPDIIYVFDFLYTQVCVTSLVCLIYIPKLWVVYKHHVGPQDYSSDADATATTQASNVTNVSMANNDVTADKQIQVELIKSEMDANMGSSAPSTPHILNIPSVHGYPNVSHITPVEASQM